MRAIVRPPGESYVRALTSIRPSPSIDLGSARRQHKQYCDALRAAGAEVFELPPADALPDSCFVQDCAIVWGPVVVIGRFGAASREGEQAAIRECLAALGPHRVSEVVAPGTLEGGDVLILGSRIVVGLSARTNRSGYAQLRDRLEPEGATVLAQPVPERLHLLSGITYLGAGTVLAADLYADAPVFSGMEVIRVPPEEAYAANALGLGRAVIVPEGYPRTAALIRERGFETLPVYLSEFAKADGGATCLSLIV